MGISTASLFTLALYGMSSFPFCSDLLVVKHFKDHRSEYVLEEVYKVEIQVQYLGESLLLGTSELQCHLKETCVYTEKADCGSSGVMGIRHGLNPSKHFLWFAVRHAGGHGCQLR